MDIKEYLKENMGCKDEDFIKPLPKPSKWSKPFWEGTKERKLLLKTCNDCGHVDHPPYLYCTNCMSEDHSWVEASGIATLFSYAINTYGVPFPFMEDLPYVLALVDLEEGIRMISNVVNCDHNKLEKGMVLQVIFEETSEDVFLPKWQPTDK